ncbi:hypothetical protein QDA02_gp79 [Microbacterium phage Margaery]|uniref:Tail assembly chaperone n=1 Tax=Microbacterium phage Margaery TaxID=2591217 RepID=A0A514DHI7_9CAUD|nr:hypothetical protein QDA02_gp79 [Microbacterium phage Margaery]QDH93086.1 hypothetical protein PBI_MARGAERY_29 [Microbacterium phage Margaery]
MKSITIDAEPREQVTVHLVGKPYLLTPPKGALGLTLAKRAQEAEKSQDIEMIWGEIMGWLTMAVGETQAKAIQARLDDNDDDLDLIHVITVMEKVVEAVTELPSSSSSD